MIVAWPLPRHDFFARGLTMAPSAATRRFKLRDRENPWFTKFRYTTVHGLGYQKESFGVTQAASCKSMASITSGIRAARIPAQL